MSGRMSGAPVPSDVVSEFRPLPPQWRFFQSQAKVRGGALEG